MKPSFHKQVRAFLKSADATAEAFSSVGWDEEHSRDAREFWCLVNYGILQEIEVYISLQREGNWVIELLVPPILPQYERQVSALCADLQQSYPPLVAAVDSDLTVVLGAIGTGDPLPTLQTLWHIFALDVVYQFVLLCCGMTAPAEEDKIPYDVPEDPYLGQDED
jgi:hypothetical protein